MRPPPLPPINPYSAPRAVVMDPHAAPYGGEYVYAGFWLRLVAVIVDSFISMAIMFVILLLGGILLGMALSGVGTINEQLQMLVPLIWLILSLIIPWLYYALCEASNWQATPGKKLLGLRVTDLDGAQISFARASGRHWAKLLSYIILYIGFMMAGWTEKKQGLHDMLANTLVIRN